MSLFEELKRRRVFRVTAAYVVAAWAVLQVADTLFPALHLPPSSVTFVAVLVVLGFPIVLVLAWAFDVTAAGITRVPGSLRFPTRAAAVATVVLAVAVTSFVALRRRAVAARLDANAVAILPFRVSGGASLAAMREGMIDLLAVKLTGEGGGPHAIDSRTTMSAWRRKVDDEKDDMPTADAVQLARKLGAGQVLLGELVGTPGHVSLSVALHSSVDGRKVVSAEAAAPPDSILPLVDRVVAKLLSQQAGEGRRAEALLSESLPAVRAYLDGQQRLRRGDYVTAMQRFNSALEQDSTFALAGLGLAQAAGWTEGMQEWRRGEAVAIKYRTRLPLPDREFVDAAYGYPQVKTARERIRLFAQMVGRAPDRMEAWHALGELYYHYGSLIGIDNAADSALAAWHRSLALDSTYMPAVEHQITIYAQRGDTLNVRRLADLIYNRVQPRSKYRTGNAWAAALALRDTTWLKDLRAQRDSLDALQLDIAGITVVEAGLAQSDLASLLATSRSRGDGEGTGPWQPIALAAVGRPHAALAAARSSQRTPGDFMMLVIAWTHSDANVPDAAATARRFVHAPFAGAVFVAASYCLDRGDMACARQGAAAMRKLAAEPPRSSDPSIGGNDAMELTKIGSSMLDAALKAHEHAPDARAALERADSQLMNTTMSEEVLPGPGALFALSSTRAHLALADYEGAYEAARRGAGTTYGFVTRAPLLLEYARLAARLRKRDEAIAAYRRYLDLRQKPEPGAPSDLVQQARRELSALTGETRI